MEFTNQEQLKEKILEIYEQNKAMRVCDIAKKVGCSAKYVTKFIRESNFKYEPKTKRKVSYMDTHFNEIKAMWEKRESTTDIAKKLNLQYSSLVKYMIQHGMPSAHKKSFFGEGGWKKLDDIYKRNKQYKTLEELGLKTTVNGKEYYEVQDFFGIENVGKEPRKPDWKLNFHELGIINFGKEYGRFGSRADERPLFHAKMYASYSKRGE